VEDRLGWIYDMDLCFWRLFYPWFDIFLRSASLGVLVLYIVCGRRNCGFGIMY
jgi:hypothetical protein